jgi:hypothetical protein
MAHPMPFIVVELGADADPFMLHIDAALAEQEHTLISDRTRAAGTKESAGAETGQPHQSVGGAGQKRSGGPGGGKYLCAARGAPDTGHPYHHAAGYR